MSQPLSSFQLRDAEGLLHPSISAAGLREAGARTFERGERVRVFDQSGDIDGLAA